MTQRTASAAHSAEAAFYKPAEVARHLRLGLNAVYAAIKQNEIRAVKIRGRLRISRAEMARISRGDAA